MFRYRLCFTKLGNLKYLSHLNLMKTMERAMRRAGLPLAFSGGYHPHPKISFGPALAVGIDSTSEYLDIELLAGLDAKAILTSLNQALPEGLKIKDSRRLKPEAESLNTLINKASYRILLQIEPASKEAIVQHFARLMQKTELPVLRTGKEGQKVVNIRPWLHKLTVEENSGDGLGINLVGETGGKGNLRPEDIFENIEPPVKVLTITRNGLWYEEKGLVTKPMDFCLKDGDRES